MKILNRLLFFLLIGIPWFPSLAKAQMVSSDQTSISVTISKGITISRTSDLNFGTVTINTGTVTINSNGAKAGGFVVNGAAGATVNITLPQKVVLSDQNGHTVAMTPTIPIYNQQNDQTTAQTFNSVLGGSATLNAQNGDLYVWFGGSFSTTGLEPGIYSGTYTAKVAYATA